MENFECGVVIEKYTGSETAVVIPPEINGLPVTRIGDEAFQLHEELTEIYIPDSVVEICESAFAYCDRLKKVHLPRSLKKIGSYAFESCRSLREFHMPDSVEEIGEEAFNYCEHLRKVHISNSVWRIGRAAFSGCWRLAEINIPDSVMEIGAAAFTDCHELERVYINAANLDWVANLAPELMETVRSNSKKNLRAVYVPTDTTMDKFIDEIDEFVDVQDFIRNLETFKPSYIKVYTVAQGDVLEVTFTNGVRNKILTSSFSSTNENIQFASQINEVMRTNNVRIVGVKVIPLGGENYDVKFTFEELD